MLMTALMVLIVADAALSNAWNDGRNTLPSRSTLWDEA